MVRHATDQLYPAPCFPHARGDGPKMRWRWLRLMKFSPRPWGWSGVIMPKLPYMPVFPTPVGMVRRDGLQAVTCIGFPHARGDGPGQRMCMKIVYEFSPRPWGWSADVTGRDLDGNVFPTPVGMVRVDVLDKTANPGFPHARGDGPNRLSSGAVVCVFSPRPWGWSELNQNESLSNTVFPTPVGMVRNRRQHSRGGEGFPHARGDGPP